MSNSHTPGPWSITPMQDTVWALDGQVQVAKVSDLPWINGKSDWLTEQANGYLIAAAPGLLIACKAALMEAEYHSPALAVILRAAIAKATNPKEAQ
jgi:hypothetical protein